MQTYADYELDQNDDEDDEQTAFENQLSALQYDKINSRPANNPAKPVDTSTQGCLQMIENGVCSHNDKCRYSYEVEACQRTALEKANKLLNSKYYVAPKKISNMNQNHVSTD